MKKILIVMPSMFIGGAERSLLGLLEAFDYSKVEVYLFLYRHEGEFMEFIPDQVHILPEMKQYKTFDVPIKSLLFSSQFAFGIARILSKIASKTHCLLSHEKHGVWMSMQYTVKYLQPLLPDIPGEYDLGIMYLGVADTLIRKTSTKKKATWNHTDYETLFPDKKMDLNTYNNVDYLVSVSDACTNKVCSFYPQIRDKAMTIENCLARNLILRQAMSYPEGMDFEDGSKILLSIGRYSYAKNFDNVPDICARLIALGHNIKWYIVGYGGDEPLIKQKIQKANMEEHVILLGKKDNPYPYIKACDIYVQPSRYEGKCVSVREAQMLCKPVVITRYDTSASQLEDGIDGIIVPMDNKGCAAGIANLLCDKKKMNYLIENCKKRDYTNAEEVEKIYRLL